MNQTTHVHYRRPREQMDQDGRVHVVVGGQYGSEGKGAVAGHLVRWESSWWNRPAIGVRVGGPNAGHSIVGPDHQKYALRHIPVAAVCDPEAMLIIAEGSEVDPVVLGAEVNHLQEAGFDVGNRLMIDPSATLLHVKYAEEEAGGLVGRIGSTGKGVGASRAARAVRTAELYGTARPYATSGTAQVLHSAIRSGNVAIIEGTQGYALGQHAGHYPYVTSGDCRAVDVLAQAGLSPWVIDPWRIFVWVVLRTHPIRVAGNSGPLPNETTWEALSRSSAGHIKPERTTVTQKVRRVAEFDADAARQALKANGAMAGSPVRVALTFLDYLFPEVAGMTSERLLPPGIRAWVSTLEGDLGAPIDMLGTGPASAIMRGAYE